MQQTCDMERHTDRTTKPSSTLGWLPASHPGTNVPQCSAGTQVVAMRVPAEPLYVNQPVNEVSLALSM